MPNVAIDLPPDVLSSLRRSPEEFVSEMRIAAAIYWYSRGEVSRSKAADVAGLTRVEFLDELARRRVDAFQIDSDDLQRELKRG